jgi:NUC130/3NT domain
MTNTVDQVQDFALLQDKVKRQPLLYKPEFLNVLATFHPLYQTLRDEPAKPALQACKVLLFLANVSHHFKNDLLFLKTEIVTTLEQYYAVLHHDTLFSFVKALITLRQKEELPAQV